MLGNYNNLHAYIDNLINNEDKTLAIDIIKAVPKISIVFLVLNIIIDTKHLLAIMLWTYLFFFVSPSKYKILSFFTELFFKNDSII